MKRPLLKLTPKQWMRFVVSPGMGIGSFVAIMATTPQENLDKLSNEAGGNHALLIGFLICLIAPAIVVEMSFVVSHRLDGFLKWDEQPLRRSVVHLAVVFALTGIISVIMPRIYFWLSPVPTSLKENVPRAMVKNGVIGLLATLIGTGIHLAMSFFHHWKIKSLEAEQYKVAAAQAQIEALKAQLDPHFMFNSLNTLTELVEINSSKSLDFLKSFGQVYRYVLQTREHESVTLQEELDFADSYLFLLKTRFGEALQVEKNVSEADLEKRLPPMTLQLLLENAVKHNVLTTSKPLRVRLMSDGKWLAVQNNLQPKSSKGYSSGIGLKNITERVLRLTEQEPVIENGSEVFMVKIPLQN
ncbi:MAG TPA: histidine kinase [Saprospiraceae bacterium]|nr:histidine kinase [Saprospiraceae bacterium]